MTELHGREIHGHDERWNARLLPLPCLTAGFAQDPVADRYDQPRFLGDGDETGGRDQPVVGTVPADQRLDTDNRSFAQIHLRLIVKDELLVLQCTP